MPSNACCFHQSVSRDENLTGTKPSWESLCLYCGNGVGAGVSERMAGVQVGRTLGSLSEPMANALSALLLTDIAPVDVTYIAVRIQLHYFRHAQGVVHSAGTLLIIALLSHSLYHH